MHHPTVYLKKEQKGEEVSLIKLVLQEVMVSEMNNINKDAEGNNNIVDYFWHYFSRDLYLTA